MVRGHNPKKKTEAQEETTTDKREMAEQIDAGRRKCYEKSRKDTYSKSSYKVGNERRGFVTVEAILIVSDIVVMLDGVGEREVSLLNSDKLESDDEVGVEGRSMVRLELEGEVTRIIGPDIVNDNDEACWE